MRFLTRMAGGTRGARFSAPRASACILTAVTLLAACTSDDTGNSRSTDDPPDATADTASDSPSLPPGTGGAPPVPPTSGGAPPDAAPDAPLEARAPDASPPVPDATPDVIDASLPDAAPPDAPAPVSLFCGDAIRGLDEECDHGTDVAHPFCAVDCRSRDALLVGPTEVAAIPTPQRRIVQDGRPAAAGPLGAAALYVDPSGSGADILQIGLVRPDGAQIGDGRGIRIDDQHLQGPYDDCALVALPGDRFVAAWTSRQTGIEPGTDVSLRTVEAADGALGDSFYANDTIPGDQYLSDAIWTGSELVVAWVDRNPAPPAVASYLRRFDAELQPIAGNERLVPEQSSVFAPFLAPFASSFAYGWISNDANVDRTVWVRAGGREWSFGVYRLIAGAQLVALDDRHLFLVINEGFDNTGSLDYRLWGAVLDVGDPVPPALVPITPLLPALPDFGEPAETQISLAVASDSVYLAWTHEKASFSRGIVLKTIPFRPADGRLEIDLSLPEIPLPSTPERRPWPQEHAALVHAPWGPSGSLFAASQDMDRTISPNQRRPDVVVQSMPLPVVRLPEVSHDE